LNIFQFEIPATHRKIRVDPAESDSIRLNQPILKLFYLPDF